MFGFAGNFELPSAGLGMLAGLNLETPTNCMDAGPAAVRPCCNIPLAYGPLRGSLNLLSFVCAGSSKQCRFR